MVPINLALRDINMEERDVTSSDSWVYNMTFDLMTRVIDVINEIDPTLWLYREILRGKERATLAQTEHFLFQYDGLHLGGEDDMDEYRMIWRDFATGWYKHPRRCITATRELSCAEQELLLSQLRTEITKWFEKRRHQVPHPKTTEERIAGIKRMAEKLGCNGISGAFLKNTPAFNYPQLFGRLSEENPTSIPLREYQQDVKAALEGKPLNEIFGAFGSNIRPSEVKSDIGSYFHYMRTRRQAAKDTIINTPAEAGPKEDVELGPHRMTQGEYGDYEAAATNGGEHTRAVWERIKAEGIQIITEEEKTPAEKMGVGDMSVMFMYPNVSLQYDLSKHLLPEGRERDPDIIDKMPDPITPEFIESVRNIQVPVAFRDIRDEYDLPGMDELVKLLGEQVRGEKGSSGPVMYVPPASSSLNFDMMRAAVRDHPPFTIITSTPDLNNKGNWIDEVYRQQDIPTGAYVDGHFGAKLPDTNANVTVHVPKSRPSHGVVSMTFNKAYWPLWPKESAGTAPAEFVRTGRMRPKKIADMVKFCTFVWEYGRMLEPAWTRLGGIKKGQ